MIKPRPSAVLCVGLAAAAFAAGAAVLWRSQTLMLGLIHWVGEERALGARNVVRRADGTVLLTNPGGMLLWSLPVWAVGTLLILISAVLGGVGAGLHIKRGRRTGQGEGLPRG
ncbi:hypothetical protein [Alienimonas californiensis]|uniref:Uncharacterized protein n=1 Tax=Alienimonas californiensis TaxID=2527989 RepID=A0A517P757_9PLAN|nr:hypothetical protein [Alienimonas californiensis]QDT15204.1 hypothetical protein CA12_12850 [Alienimonas californiensis]